VPDTQDSSPGSSKAVAILVYTLLRVGLFALVWALIAFLTPLNGLWAAAAAILISGAISVVVLDRQRGEVGAAAAGFFGRINARIEASAAAEDEDEDDESGEAQEQPQHKAVDQE